MIQLPTTCFAEDEGSLTNSGRWLQWHWAGGTPPGEAEIDTWIMAQLHLRLKALYQKDGGKVPDPIVKLDWRYKDPGDPTPEELAKELNGSVLEDVLDPTDPTKVVLQKGKQVASFAALRDDGTTACGCWIYSGCFNESGNNMARRDNSDVGRHRRLLKMGVVLAGQSPHSLQPRFGGPEGQSLGSDPQADVVGRRQMDGI